MLLEHKANVDARDVSGITPLYAAAGEGNTDTVSLLIDHHANIEATDNDGATALHRATA